MITVIPAIDLKNGRCVRLRQGRAEDETVYSNDPVAMARHWVSQGARYLHIVDLDGAFQGKPVHIQMIQDIATAAGIPVEIGGGLRTDRDIRQLLDCGVDRVIVGTRVLSEPESLLGMVKSFGHHLAVGIDANEGRVQIRGWIETTGRRAVDLAKEMDRAGVATLIYTDTARDGMLKGVNDTAVGDICRSVRCNVIASGGVSSPADMERLVALGQKNLIGAITGKALYEGSTTIPDLQAAGEGKAGPV